MASGLTDQIREQRERLFKEIAAHSGLPQARCDAGRISGTAKRLAASHCVLTGWGCTERMKGLPGLGKSAGTVSSGLFRRGEGPATLSSDSTETSPAKPPCAAPRKVRRATRPRKGISGFPVNFQFSLTSEDRGKESTVTFDTHRLVAAPSGGET